MKFKKISQGLVHVYTGPGKGKTTAALGLALRAISYKKKVLIVQFIKGPWRSGDLDAVKKLKPYLNIYAMGQGFIKILGDKKPLAVHKRAAKDALGYAKKQIKTGKYNIVILDEINVAIKKKLLTQKEVVNLIRTKPSKVELILTGRGATAKIKKYADYVSEIKDIKHPFRKGILARESIDY